MSTPVSVQVSVPFFCFVLCVLPVLCKMSVVAKFGMLMLYKQSSVNVSTPFQYLVMIY